LRHIWNVKVKIKRWSMNRYGEWRYSSTIFNVGTRWRWVVSFTSRPLYPWGKFPRTHCIGGCVDPTDGLDAVEKRNIFCRYRESNLRRSAHSPSLYRLSYPGSLFKIYVQDFDSVLLMCEWYVWKYCVFEILQLQKLGNERPWDVGARIFRVIMNSFNICTTETVVWAVTPSCWNERPHSSTSKR
jgi:hypothetical protein